MLSAITRYRTAVSAHIETILAAPAPFPLHSPNGASADSSSLTPYDFLAPAQALAHGGKRTRALFALAGWQAASHYDASSLESCPTEKMPIGLGAALELYQLSALIHDDVLDEAATRRGVPTAHKMFAQHHYSHAFLGSSEEYGKKIALLLGDYVLSLAGHTLEEALSHESLRCETSTAGSIRQLFHSMAAEVAFGQYIDVHAEFSPLADCESEAISSALTVLHHKAARYSVTIPTLLGALHGQSHLDIHNSDLLEELERICTPLGEAFQLRDDVLGIFGEPEVTGKPAGDDVSEGKRTVLLAVTRSRASEEERSIIDAHLGTQLSHSALTQIRSIIHTSGAYAQHEEMITEREQRAQKALQASSHHLDVLAYLAQQLSGRTA